MWRDVVITHDHEGRCRHLSKARVSKERSILNRERAEIRPAIAIARWGKQYTGFDARFGHVHYRSIVGIGKPCAQQHPSSVPT
jgi:hypothetical protein